MIAPQQQERLAEMVRCGIPQETADAGRKVLETFGDGTGWAIFAQPDEDPPVLEMEQIETGLFIRVETFAKT